MPQLKAELKKKGPFSSIEQEATLAIMRTSDLLENRFARLLRENGFTMSQYNVLRILRGEGKPMPCLEVADRMIQVVPAITRVVDQLLKLQMIDKVQSDKDRRVYLIALKPKARKLLSKLDDPVLELHSALLSGLNKTEQKSMIKLLEKIRGSIVRTS